MGDFDPAIVVVVALAVEKETDVPRGKSAKSSKEWFLQSSKFGHKCQRLIKCSHLDHHTDTVFM